MSGDTLPIDPASCAPDKWWLVEIFEGKSVGYRTALGRWYLAGLGAFSPYDDRDVTVLAEAVRADECGCDVGLHETVLRADRDRWKAECEKAQAEWDEALAEVRRLRTTLRMEMETDGIPIASAVDPDPTSASRLRLAEETLNAVADGDRHCRATRMAADLYARRRVLLEAEAVSAREQERDAEIAAVEDAITRYATGPGKAAAAIAALDELRNERRGK